MIVGTIELEHVIECRKCGHEARASSERRLLAKMTWHLWSRCGLPTRTALEALWVLAKPRKAGGGKP